MKKTILTLAFALMASASALAGEAKDYKVYINPGHGGYDPNDRNVAIPPYETGDPEGFWESKSNLSKGLALQAMLKAKGYSADISRTTNTSADDLGLSTIVALSNASGADVFFSIHSNATGTAVRRNYPLMLYRGYDGEPQLPGSVELCTILNNHLLENQVTYWTKNSPDIRGDWSFFKEWGTSGLGALRGQTMPSMLSEGSFHDYVPEAYRLLSDDFCWLEAYHFRRAVDEYFKVEGEKTGHIFGRLTDNRLPRDGSYLKYGADTYACVMGAKVELYDADGNLVDTYTTHSVNVNGVYAFKNLNPGTYTVKTKVDTHYDAEKTVEVKADIVTYANFELSRVRSTPPVVESYSPIWNDGDEALLCNTPVVFNFNWDMDTEATEAAFTIDPAVEGNIVWEDLNHRMVFTPKKAYDTNTHYTVTLSKAAKHPGDICMENDVVFGFTTTDRNFMEIIGQSPRQDDMVHFHNAAIELRFDLNPNTVDVLKQVICSDAEGNKVSFNKRGMSNSGKTNLGYGFFRIPFMNDLVPGEKYTVTISGDMADMDGITIQNAQSFTFTATDAGTEKTTALLAQIDDVDLFAYDEEQAVAVEKNGIALESSKALFDKAVAFSYTFDGTAPGEALWKYTAPVAAIRGDGNLGVHLCGDLSGNHVYLMFTSAAFTQYVHVADMDFLGWRYIEVPLAQLGTDEDYSLTGLKLVQTEGAQSKTGTFMLDRIYTGATTGIENNVINTAISVGPNPATEYIIANGDTFINGIELYNLEGQRIAATAGNALYVADIADGVYIARVATASAAICSKIVIKH